VSSDSDLAKIYGVTNRRGCEIRAFQRNIKRFPDDFAVQFIRASKKKAKKDRNRSLSITNCDYSKKGKGGADGAKFAVGFTEHGAIMLQHPETVKRDSCETERFRG